MTEIRGQCPSHSGDTGGSDSYFYNPDKKQGHCKSCDLATWEHDGVLYGKRRGKGFKIKSLDGAPLTETPESGNKDFDVFGDEEDFTPKAVVEKEYQPWRGIAEATLREFGVVSTDDKIIFPYPSGGTKTRVKAQKEFYAKGLKSDELFGMNLFPSGCSKKVTITEGECFTPDAEVFTPSGWVALKDYSGEPVLQVHQDRSAGFTNPLAVVDKHFEGNLVEYVSGSYYSLTTPTHNLVREHPKEGLKKFKAGKNSYFNVPRTFTRRDAYGYISTLEAKLWVMLSADFTFRKEGDIYGALKKERKAARAKELLDQYGVRFSMNKDARGYWGIFIHRGHNIGFIQKDLPFCLSWHPDKEEILKEVIFWDGNYVKTRNQAEFSSNRKHNIDVVQMLAHSCGYVSTIIYRSNEYGEWMKASILFSKTNSSTQKGYNSIPYSGRVMCLTVETGMLAVRQKGSISISGNCDTLSAWQMLQSGRYLNPVVSLPSATPSGKLWEKCKRWLDSFDEIILSVDNDGPGKKIAEKISLMFPGKVKVMDHGQYKDANDFLMNGDAQAYKNAWWSAKKFRPDDMLVDSEDYLKLYDESPDFEYFPTAIPELDEKILGINKGYFTVIQAPTGTGKTEVMRYLEWQCLTQSDFTFAYMHLEESRLRSLLGLVSYKLGSNVTLKKFIDEKGLDEEVREAIKDLASSDRMIQFNFNPEDGYESLIDKIKYLVAAFEVDYVFFEPLQDLVHGEDKEGKLADLSSRLGTLASDLDVGIVTIAHQNQNGDTMYATMIGKKAAFEITLHRDQEAEDHEERNRTRIKVGRKNRVGLGNGPAGALDFDVDSYTLIPVEPPKEPKTPGDRDDF